MTQKSGQSTSSRKKPGSARNYARGSANERRIRKDLYDNEGALLVLKAGGSKSPVTKELAADVYEEAPPKVDLIGVFRGSLNRDHLGHDLFSSQCVAFQAKPAKGKLKPDEIKGLKIFSGLTGVCSYECWWDRGARYSPIECVCEEGALSFFCLRQERNRADR